MTCVVNLATGKGESGKRETTWSFTSEEDIHERLRLESVATAVLWEAHRDLVGSQTQCSVVGSSDF